MFRKRFAFPRSETKKATLNMAGKGMLTAWSNAIHHRHPIASILTYCKRDVNALSPTSLRVLPLEPWNWNAQRKQQSPGPIQLAVPDRWLCTWQCCSRRCSGYSDGQNHLFRTLKRSKPVCSFYRANVGRALVLVADLVLTVNRAATFFCLHQTFKH